jgi:NAD(P)H-hydrate epimerase
LNHDYDPTIILSNENKLQEVPAYQLKIFIAAGGTVVSFNNIAESKPDIIVDALIGYSLNSSPEGIVLEMINFINNVNVPVVSLDIPTGIVSTTGENPGEFIKADKTLTLALPKTGLLPGKCGNIILADIGLPKTVYNKLGLQYISPFRDNYRIPVRALE